MMMKTSIAVVACVLLCSSLLFVGAQNSFGPDACCFKLYPKQLAAKRVKTYKYTDSRCAFEAVVFTMKKGGRFCVDPKKKWVQDIVTSKEWDHTKTNISSVTLF